MKRPFLRKTDPRKELAAKRAEFEGVREALKADPLQVKHEEKNPGRIEAFMEQAAEQLDEAERMIPAMKGPPQKAWLHSFRKALELADKHMLMAWNDHTIIREGGRLAKLRDPKFPECDEWMDNQLRRQPNAKSPELWNRAPDWITDRIGIDRFAKRLTDSRERLGLKRKYRRN